LLQFSNNFSCLSSCLFTILLPYIGMLWDYTVASIFLVYSLSRRTDTFWQDCYQFFALSVHRFYKWFLTMHIPEWAFRF
jgi:hypothetical protein